MKNYMKFIIWSLSLICFSASYAQNLSWNEQRRFRVCIYNAMENYEMYGSLYDDNYRVDFVNLFVSEDTEIYNDLLGVSTVPTLSVYNYIKNVEEKTDLVEVKIRNLNIGEFYRSGDDWMVDVEFDKEMRYYNKNGLPLSSRAYYGADYRMVATFLLDQYQDDADDDGKESISTFRARITALRGEIESEKTPLPDEYFAVSRSVVKEKSGEEKPNPRDLDASWNGNALDFMQVSEFNYALIPTTIDKVRFAYSRDNDINVKHIAVDGF